MLMVLDFFSGLAAELGFENLNTYMNSFYRENNENPTTTKKLETYLWNNQEKKFFKDILTDLYMVNPNIYN